MRGHMRLIRKFSFAGDTVLDPPAGTGSTAVAAERHSVSIEVDPGYVRMAGGNRKPASPRLTPHGRRSRSAPCR